MTAFERGEMGRIEGMIAIGAAPFAHVARLMSLDAFVVPVLEDAAAEELRRWTLAGAAMVWSALLLLFC